MTSSSHLPSVYGLYVIFRLYCSILNTKPKTERYTHGKSRECVNWTHSYTWQTRRHDSTLLKYTTCGEHMNINVMAGSTRRELSEIRAPRERTPRELPSRERESESESERGGHTSRRGSGERGWAWACSLLEHAQRHLLVGLARHVHHEEPLRGVRLVRGLGPGLGLRG